MKGELSIPLLLLFLSGCNNHNPPDHHITAGEFPAKDSITYAQGFTLSNGANGVKSITVSNPWQYAENISYHYLLSDSFRVSRVIDEFNCEIKTPVKRVVCLSTTHIGFLEFITETGSVAGVSGKDFICNRDIALKFSNGLIQDVGYDENLNYELLLQLQPDVVFSYGVSSAVTKTMKKLNELGIPVVMIGEYLEQEPLAKMEWVKMFAAFYNKERIIGHKFDSVAGRYNNIIKLSSSVKGTKPTVLLGLPFRGTWYVSGVQSYIAQLINDAGGRYIWDDLQFNESRPMNLESIFERAIQADFWLNTGDAETLNSIKEVDNRFQQLQAFQNQQIYNNNALMNATGGNAFFESGVVEPDIILADLVSILHPQLLPSHSLKYYRKLYWQNNEHFR